MDKFTASLLDKNHRLEGTLLELKKEVDQYKSERDTLNSKLNQVYEDNYQMEGKYRDMKAERDTLIDDLTWYKAKVERLEKESEHYRIRAENAMELAESENSKVLKLEHENARLTRLTHKLTIHRTMWDNLKDWRRDMLEIDTNDTQLISLGLVMDDLEKDNLYKERDSNG